MRGGHPEVPNLQREQIPTDAYWFVSHDEDLCIEKIIILHLSSGSHIVNRTWRLIVKYVNSTCNIT